MTNIKCKGGKEIDLLAVNPKTGLKYHVEARVGTSPSFKIREKDTYISKGRAYKIGLDYFDKEKFKHSVVTDKIQGIFGSLDYQKVLVVWNVQNENCYDAAKDYGILIWRIHDLISILLRKSRETKGSRDNVLRLLDLMRVFEEEKMSLELKRRKEEYKHIKKTSKEREKWLKPPTTTKKALKEIEKWKNM
jgi:hypothetical protein